MAAAAGYTRRPRTRIVRVAGREVAGAVARVALKGIFLPLLPVASGWLETKRIWEVIRPAPMAGLAMGLAAAIASLESMLKLFGFGR